MDLLSLFSKTKEAVALDIGSNSIKLVQMRQAKKGWELQKLGLAYLPPEAIVDGSIIDSMTVTNTIANLLREHKIKVKEAVSSLAGHSVIIKKVSLAAMTEEELGESIQWEAEQYIPFPMTDVNIDFQILGENQDAKGKKDVINDYVNVIKEAGLNPIVMDVDSFALENMVEINYALAPNENVAMVSIGASIMSISVIAGGVTVFTRSTPAGGNQYTEEIQRHFNVSFKEAEDIKLGRPGAQVNPEEAAAVVSGVTNNMALEVKRSLDFFLGGNPSVIIGRIMLAGGAAKTKGLREALQDRTAMPVELVNPFNGLTLNPKNFANEYLTDMAPHFGVAVGLATRRLGDR